MSASSPPTTTPPLHAWHAGLARAMATVAEAGFVEHLGDALAGLAQIESMMLALERKGLPPQPLYQRGIAEQYREALIERYYARGYMLDPFCLAMEDGLAEGFYPLAEIAPDDFFSSEYYKTYYLKAGSSEDCHYIIDLDEQRKVSLCMYQGHSGARLSDEQLDLLSSARELVRELFLQFDRNGGLEQLLAGSGDRTQASRSRLNRHIREAFMNFGSDCLTEREREIAHLLLRGHSVKSSARMLDISPETVRMHRKHLYTKLEINSQAELFSLFIDWLTRDGPA
ncbi:helix-turn-helix transcriptional regulator [Pseudomonas citronellolis]|uniref:helix-turn-helix transcriptional regulator n=1 Tax=Pseudomonas citronellolis TaxID=53408 RepID=UPI0023E43F39|nr:LuxR C-terminal-related transcriptional regulator [Pseudomonas citronellolis]MDF3935820.1 LuxR C-terminal-related transcriptional regulator [Pseudomonas citronellolis]